MDVAWQDLGLLHLSLGVLAALICLVEVRSDSSTSIFTVSPSVLMSLKRKLHSEQMARSVKRAKQCTEPRLDPRKDKREAFYRELHAKHQELEAMQREDVRSKCLREWEEIREERKRREFRAKPVRHYSCIPKAFEKEFKPTVPLSPKLHTSSRCRLHPSTSNLH